MIFPWLPNFNLTLETLNLVSSCVVNASWLGMECICLDLCSKVLNLLAHSYLNSLLHHWSQILWVWLCLYPYCFPMLWPSRKPFINDTFTLSSIPFIQIFCLHKPISGFSLIAKITRLSMEYDLHLEPFH